MRRPSTSNIVVALAALFVGRALAQGSPPVTVTEIREVTPQSIQDTIEDMRLKNDGLLARIRGIESRPPRVILRTDTIVTPPDTVYSFVDVRDGQLTFDLFTNNTHELQQGINVADCDDGFQISAGEVSCNRARLGHLWLAGELAYPYSSVGLEWRRSFRSSMDIYVGISTKGSLVLRVRSGVRVF